MTSSSSSSGQEPEGTEPGMRRPATPIPPPAMNLASNFNDRPLSLVSGLKQSSKRKLAAGIAQNIENYIIGQGWPVGKVIFSETELMKRYSVSRSIVREAVRLLEQHTTARMRRGPRGGLVVCKPDSGPVTNTVAVYLEYEGVTSFQLFEARVALELAVVELATERITPEGVQKLQATLVAETEMPVEHLGQHTKDIHIAIAQVAESPAFPLFVAVLINLSDARATHVNEVKPPEIYRAHSAIVSAIISQDAALARHRMKRHLEAMTPWLADRRVTDSHPTRGTT